MAKKKESGLLKGILLVVVVTLFNGFGQLFQKIGMNNFQADFASIITNAPLILGIVFYGISALLLVYAFKFGQLSVLFPFVSLTFVWVLILSAIVLHEPVALRDFFGIVSIIVGVSLVGSR